MSESSNLHRIRASKYYKPRFINALAIFNIVFLLYNTIPVSLLQLIPIVFMIAVILKSAKFTWIYSVMLSDSQECALSIVNRLDVQLSNFCWLVNKMNLHCLFYIFLLAAFLYLVEKFATVRLSWWILGNLCILYLGATRYTKSILKYKMRLYREYKKYVIHVIEPNSPEKDHKEQDSDSEIADLSAQ